MFEEWSVGNVAGVLVAVLLAVALIWGVVQLGPVAIDRWF